MCLDFIIIVKYDNINKLSDKSHHQNHSNLKSRSNNYQNSLLLNFYKIMHSKIAHDKDSQ